MNKGIYIGAQPPVRHFGELSQRIRSREVRSLRGSPFAFLRE